LRSPPSFFAFILMLSEWGCKRIGRLQRYGKALSLRSC
jgi:hypothetical protein